MRIQFINSSGKLHEYNFIRVAVPEEDITIYSDTGYAQFATDEIAEYYHNHNIKVIKANDYAHINNRHLRILLNLFSGLRLIWKSRIEKYDYCFIHYLSTRRAILSLLIPSSTKQILITYGTDILRRNNFNNFFFRKMLDRAYLIDFTSGNLKYTFENAYGKKYANKSIEIAFPCYSYGYINALQGKLSKDDIKNHFNFPLDKSVVVCGHTSTNEEQFDKMIDALEKIDDQAKSKYQFVFFMTYGAGDYKEYRAHIEQKLTNHTLSYTVLNKFLTSEEVAMIHIVSDVHITSIKTDAISFFMLEEMYAGATLLYGSWLHYVEFEGENNFGTMSFEDFDDLTIKLNMIAKGEIPNKPSNIKSMIESLSSNESIHEEWSKILYKK